MAKMTLLQVYSPWRDSGPAWAEEQRSWGQLAVTWDDQGISWAEALQPWSASLSSPPIRVMPVPAEFRVAAIAQEYRLQPVVPKS